MYVRTYVFMYIYTYFQGEVEDGEKRITVMETSTGNKITGEDAPKKAELDQWLEDHPG